MKLRDKNVAKLNCLMNEALSHAEMNFASIRTSVVEQASNRADSRTLQCLIAKRMDGSFPANKFRCHYHYISPRLFISIRILISIDVLRGNKNHVAYNT